MSIANVDFDAVAREIDQMPALNWKIKFGSEGYNVTVNFIIKGIVPEQSLVSIYGPSGSFKSFLALSWCCHIASGIDWDGRKVIPGSVLYIAAEGGVGVSKRIKAWEKQYETEISKSLARIDHPVFPAETKQVNELLEACRQVEIESGQPLKLIVFDTLARCFGGSDENSAKDMGAFIKGCDAIKAATGATVLIVHHTGKNPEKGARGSSALRAALDAEISVQRESGRSLVLTCTKMKDAEQPAGTAYELVSIPLLTDEDGEWVTSLTVVDAGREPSTDKSQSKSISKNHQAVWQAVRSRKATGEPTTYEVIRDDLKAQDLDIKHYSRWVNDLVKRGQLLRDGDELSMPAHSDEA